MQRREATLKEKLGEHYRKRDFKAKKQTASTMGVSFFLGILFTSILEVLVILLPRLYQPDDGAQGASTVGYRLAQLIYIWLFVETGLNWYNTYYDLTNRVTKETKALHFPVVSETPPGWKNCPTCMLDAPPRSHHCTLCNHCILKRDNHCFVTGSCIGYHNQRTFVVFLLYALITSVYTSYLQICYLDQEIPFTEHWASFYFPLSGLWQYLSGNVAFLNFFLLIHLICSLASIGFAAFFLWWQLVIITRGQTSFEVWKRVSVFRRRAILDNFRDAFGDFPTFMLILFVPMRMMMPGDGIKWVIEPKAEKGH